MARRRARRASRPGRHRSIEPSPVAGAWASVVLVCGLVAYLVDSVTVVIMCIVIGLCAVVIAVAALYAPERVGATSPAPAREPHSSGKPSSARPAPARPGTKPRACSARCRTSTKPVSSCRCSCKGRTHGSEAPGGAAKPRKNVPVPSSPPRRSPNDDGSRNWLLSPEAKRLERRIVREERRKRRHQDG